MTPELSFKASETLERKTVNDKANQLLTYMAFSYKPGMVDMMERGSPNRRCETRKRLLLGARYLHDRRNGMEGGRAEILNVSYAGARAVVGKDVKLGDRLRLLTYFQGDRPTEIGAIVRWREDLPGGSRRVVGLQLLQD